MTYSSLAQLTDRVGLSLLIDLTDRGEVALGVVDEAVVDRALAEADTMIDGFLGARYVLPLATVPGLLADIATTIALWKLHVTMPEEKIVKDYDAALKTLEQIARGIIRVPDATGIEPAGASTNQVQITDRERPFTETNMKGFI